MNPSKCKCDQDQTQSWSIISTCIMFPFVVVIVYLSHWATGNHWCNRRWRCIPNQTSRRCVGLLIVVVNAGLAADVPLAQRPLVQFTLFLWQNKGKSPDYGLGMDLVSKLVPVTENAKPTAHFIFEKMDSVARWGLKLPTKKASV